MNSTVARRAALNSLIAAIIAGVIYIVISLLTGASLSNSSVIWTALLIAGITFIVAFILTSLFTVYFSRKRAA